MVGNESYLRMLINILDQVATKWKEIGIALSFRPCDLDCIEQAPMLMVKGPKAYLQELIRQWLEWTSPEHNLPTIVALHDALLDSMVDEPQLAMELLKKGV